MDELDSRRYGGLAAEVQTPKSYKVIKLKESKPYMMREREREREREKPIYGKVGLKDRSHGNS